jgi:hypothetical protein
MAATPEQKRLAAEVAAELRAEGKLPAERPLRVVTGKSEAEPSPPADDIPPVSNLEAFEGCPDGADLERPLISSRTQPRRSPLSRRSTPCNGRACRSSRGDGLWPTKSRLANPAS